MTAADRFGWENGDIQISQCAHCRHKRIDGAFCAAFPNGIPDVILSNEHDHHQPFPGDNGIQFEPVTNSTRA